MQSTETFQDVLNAAFFHFTLLLLLLLFRFSLLLHYHHLICLLKLLLLCCNFFLLSCVYLVLLYVLYSFFFLLFLRFFHFFGIFFFLFCFLNFLLLNICWQIVAAQNTIVVSVVVVICWKVAAIAIVMAYGICERERKEGEKLQKFRLVSFCLEAKNTAILSRDVDGEFISD